MCRGLAPESREAGTNRKMDGRKYGSTNVYITERMTKGTTTIDNLTTLAYCKQVMKQEKQSQKAQSVDGISRIFIVSLANCDGNIP